MGSKPVNTLFSFRCPRCGESVGLKSPSEHIKFKSDFCPRCATKLDWSSIDGSEPIAAPAIDLSQANP